jgi:hypothetical protein
VECSEPGGRAKRRAGGARREPPRPRPKLADEVKTLLRDELIAGARTEEEVTGPGGLLRRLNRRLVERAMGVELTAYLSCEPDQEPPSETGNTRNGVDAEDARHRHSGRDEPTQERVRIRPTSRQPLHDELRRRRAETRWLFGRTLGIVMSVVRPPRVAARGGCICMCPVSLRRWSTTWTRLRVGPGGRCV